MEKWEGWGRKKVGEVIASTVWWVVFFCVWLLKIFYLFLLLYLGFSITDQAPQREIMLQKAVSALRMEVGWVKNTDGVKTTIPSSLEIVSFSIALYQGEWVDSLWFVAVEGEIACPALGL